MCLPYPHALVYFKKPDQLDCGQTFVHVCTKISVIHLPASNGRTSQGSIWISPQHIANGRLGPQLRILLMQPDNMRRHRLRFGLAQPLEETTLQSKLRNPLLGLHNGRHLEKPIGFTDVAHTGRPAATHNNAVRCFIDDFEMVRDQGSFIVLRSAQFLRRPEVSCSFGTLIFPREVGSLKRISYSSSAPNPS